jgi:hypothetical protein
VTSSFCVNRKKRLGFTESPRRLRSIATTQKSKKCLAMLTRLVTRGVLLRPLEGNMRKFVRFLPRALPFHLLVFLAGALMLLGAFAPKANAGLIAYFNFEGTPTPPYPVNLQSRVPPGFLLTTMTTNYNSADTVAVTPGIPMNVAVGDPDPNNTALGLKRTELNSPANFNIPLFSSQGFFSDLTVTFAVTNTGNGFTAVSLFYSTNGGGTFTMAPGQTFLFPTGTITTTVGFTAPAAANNQNLLVLRLQFTGGHSTANNLQTTIDNIQINGTIVPEPTTVAGGLLGVLGLCWHQRRRLIRSVRFRRT